MCILYVEMMYSIFLILIVFGSFLLVSLSLFLSFYLVSLRMAPKRKSASSWNPISSEASSSSNPTPSHVRFRDDKAHQDFSENF